MHFIIFYIGYSGHGDGWVSLPIPGSLVGIAQTADKFFRGGMAYVNILT